MVPLSKSGVRKHRGFESHPLRQARTSRTLRADPAGRCAPRDDLPVTTRRSQAGAIAKALEPHLPIALGSLCVWGDWFGKPGDNIHTVIGALAHGKTLILDFQDGEVMTVLEPGGTAFDRDAAPGRPHLQIESARRVEWGWFVYGLPRAPENWFVETHWLDEGVVRAASTADWYEPEFAPSTKEPAVTFI
jgi:hypothetical protein